MSHDVVEVISSDESIIVQIGFGEICLYFFVSQVLAQLLGNLFQFQNGEFSCPIDIEGYEDFVDLLSFFFVAQFGSGKSQEFSKVNTSWLIFIEFG